MQKVDVMYYYIWHEISNNYSECATNSNRSLFVLVEQAP